ncbi:FTR1 family iron permease [Anabaena cylindrica FACHB-243]|uniref:Iron permease FTR1 n=1 Tax=Anabaena cylindrica (strain ATCC 27899 / PCC 7122) TaxID=272123 RepID=K9ZHX3_ANACC|nr:MULTISPECIES: FTR1 family protein [Anabaena]AFZ58359.1 iron permease FTR1 [Anabaena cylindrica PCC 7122]MBD2416954.1 FTR1 family iron permease [Anabaena cylindrica FACHB-243]MBY5281826.1 FTR1 family iron permease [Anabaena sp. CCAP 1446/1C]MBY5308822.1 FTR1 family iron permease [Anabaena sp. CCAP 1446/1C]MCM2406488.1 FTR1 family iron permease [Anabaena sp. CCAP 1446/1C]
MNFSTAIPTFVITLREGVEAALVVGIVLALLKKAKQSRLNPWVYAGVAVGLVVSALIGVLFSWLIKILGAINPQYTPVIEPMLEGVFSVLAIVMLSWMLIWMTKQARFMKAQVEGAVTEALTQNSNAGWGVFSLILVAVVREGFETVLFVAANFQQGLIPTLGALSGLAAASVIGILLFKWGVKINIRQFFQVMGILLVLIVAGLVVSALQHFDTAMSSLALSSRASENLCFYYERFTKVHSCILGPMVWNTANILPDDNFPGIIFKSLFGYRDKIYIVQAVGYFVFLLSIGGLYLRSITGSSSQAKKNIRVDDQKSISP